MAQSSIHRRGTRFVSGVFLLALLLSHLPHLYADGGAGISNVEPNVGREIKPNEPPKPILPRDITGLVAPSAGEIHDFLYPPATDSHVINHTK